MYPISLLFYIYDKPDAFGFLIVKFPFLSSNTSASPAYGVYISQLIRYATASVQYNAVLDCGQLLLQKLLSQEFVEPRLESSLRIFFGRRHELVDNNGILVSQMTTDMFAYHLTLSKPVSSFHRLWPIYG